jgi:hypothetical protein
MTPETLPKDGNFRLINLDDDPYYRAEEALLELTETICEIHGHYTGRYLWLWRLLEWTATKLIWRKP